MDHDAGADATLICVQEHRLCVLHLYGISMLSLSKHAAGLDRTLRRSSGCRLASISDAPWDVQRAECACLSRGKVSP